MGRIFATASMAALIAGTAGAASAQTAPADDSAYLGEIVVTARKREEDVQRTPVAISVVSRDDIERKSIQTLKDIQRITPGLTFQQTPYDPMNSLIGIRGQRAADNLQGQDPSVGQYVDGVYTATTGVTNVSNLLDLERIEVLKGPQGTLYGRNTTGGSVNIVTALPNYDGFHGDVRVQVGNYARAELSGTVNIPIADNVALRVSGSSVEHKGYAHDTYTNTDVLDEHSRSIRAALRMNPTDKLEVVVRGDYTRGNGGGIAWHTEATAAVPAGLQAALFNGIPLGATTAAQGLALLNATINPDPYKVSYYTTPFSRLSAYGGSVTASYSITDNIDLKSITAYRRYKRVADASFVPYGVIHTYIDNSTNMFTEELQLQGSSFDNRLNWIAGYYYYDTDGLDFAEVTALTRLNSANPSNTDADLSTTSHSGYAQGTYAATDKLKLTAGVRYTHEEKDILARNHTPFTCDIAGLPSNTALANCQKAFSAKFNNTSYALSADYTINESWFVYARTATGFKSGGFNQRANAGTSFAPEKVKDYELGVKLTTFDHRLRMAGDIFRSKYTNIQRSVIGPVGATSFLRNAARATIDGAELSFDAAPTKHLTISGTAAYVEPKYDNYVTFVNGVPMDISDRKFPGQPKWQTSLAASYSADVPMGELVGSLDWSTQSLVDFQPDNHGPAMPASATMQRGYSLWNARLQLNVDEAGLKVAFWARNLFDKKYFANTIDIQSLGIASGALGEPRTFGLDIRKSF